MSTEDQAKEGVSLEAQEAKIRAWADLNGYSDIEIFTDAGISGSSMDKREGLHAALKVVGKDDALVVQSLSRLARSTEYTLEIADMLMDRNADRERFSGCPGYADIGGVGRRTFKKGAAS